jgi:hypothetical protein
MPDEEDDETQQGDQDSLLQQALSGGGMWDGQPLPGTPDSAAKVTDAALSSPASGNTPIPYRPGYDPSAAATPAPTPSAQPAEPSAPQVSPKDLSLDMSKIPGNLLAQKTTPVSIPKPATGSNNPKLADLAREQAMYGKPLDPSAVDPATGKSKYKMGVGGKILGSLTNFASGFSKNPSTVYVGPGATNSRYARDESMREGNLANINTQIGTQKTLDTENEKQYEDAIKQAYEGQVGDARIRTAEAIESRAATAGELADTKEKLSKTQGDLNEARANKAQNAAPTNEFSGWYSSFKQENGRNPTAKEIQSFELQKARAGKDTTAADTQKAIQVAEYKGRQLDSLDRQKEGERTKRYAEVDKDVTTKYNPEKLAAARKAVDDALDTKYAPKVQQMSDEADKMLGLTKAGSKLQSSSATSTTNPTPSAKPNAAPRPQPKVGDYIPVKGKDGTTTMRKVLDWNPQTKKPIVAPAGQ